MADPDRSGLLNVEKYAFDIAPWSTSKGCVPSVDVSNSPKGFTFEYRQLKNATDLSYIFQYSDDLINWVSPNAPTQIGSFDSGNYVLNTLLDQTTRPSRFYRMKLSLFSGPAPQLAAPSNVNGKPLATVQVELNWTDNTANETGFAIERKGPNDVDFVQIATIGSDVTSYVDSHVSGGTAYTYQIRAIQGATQSDPSAQAQITTQQGIGLADLTNSALSLVQAQINDASSQGTGTLWASQPGAMRVFDNTGSLQKIYRLYSATSMTTTQPFELVNDVPAGGASGWSAAPALWVDLNAPVTIQGVNDSNGNPVSSYPILNPRDPADPTKMVSIDGFYLGTTGPSGTIPGTTAVPLASNVGANPAPMPVKWMYTLRNGEIISPDAGGSGRTATFGSSSIRPTMANPIVGRIAFWTDDETCKVNINTAAGSVSNRPDRNGNFPLTPSGKPDLLPAPWDTPRFGGIWEDIKLFAYDQPIHGEYQRAPGHPATTILYNIFDGLGIPMADVGAPVTTFNQSFTSAQNKPNATSSPTSLFKLLPRYNDDFGSNAGMANTTFPNAIQSVTQKSGPLYTTVDELLYAANFTSGQQAEVAEFFLTASSRAPELNLFGTPRIAMWPIPDPSGTTPDGVNTKASVQSPHDQLIASCATTGTGAGVHPYYFVRRDRTSATVDAAIPRNAELYRYLQILTSSQIPGFGGTFSSKYGQNENNQILTEMVDYIRCTNPFDHSFADYNTTVRYTPSGAGGSEVVPLTIGNTSGLGRIYTVSEVALHIICTADGNSPLGAYQEPISTPPEWTGPNNYGVKVSPVVGSANDPLYVSNLPERQFLRDSSGNIVAIDGSAATKTTNPGMAFPCNETLSTTGAYVGPNAPRSSYTPLAPDQRRLQAMLIFEVASPMNGYDWMGADVRINVSGANGISIAGVNPFPGMPANATGANSNGDGYVDGTPGFSWSMTGLSTWGGLPGFHALMNSLQLIGGNILNMRYNAWSGRGGLVQRNVGSNSLDTMGTTSTLNDMFVPQGDATALKPGTPNVPYRPVSNPFTVSSAGPLPIAGTCTVTLQIPKNTGAQRGQSAANNVIFQTLNLNFSSVPQPSAPPDLPVWGIDDSGRISHAPDWWGFDNRIGWNSYSYSPVQANGALGWSCVIRKDNAAPGAGAWSYKSTNGSVTGAGRSDVVRSLLAKDGDYRLTAAKNTIAADGSNDFVSLPGTSKLVHLLMDSTLAPRSNAVPGCDVGGKLAAGATYAPSWVPKVPSNPLNTSIQVMGDWDNGTPGVTDGAYANWPDCGNIYSIGGVAPYFNGAGQVSDVTAFSSYFMTNRIIPSPVMFGSLPTGVTEGITWKTLLFRPQLNRPNDAYGPKDYLFLDLFNMPVVEPYALSDVFSTAGKVNMNYQIVPFTYITRSTSIRAVLGSELVARIPAASVAKYPSTTSPYYKGVVFPTTGVSQSSLPVSPSGPAQARLPINLDELDGTLRQFQDKFAAGDLFRSAAEICDIYLVPKDSVNPALYKNWVTSGPPYHTADNSWYGSDFAGVGDNVRERPYATIYPRLTTKSNTFTVHYTVQSLKNPSGDPSQWSEDRGIVLGEYRGSTTIERYVDPNDPRIPDYGSGYDPTAMPSIESFYKWRSVNIRQFYP